MLDIIALIFICKHIGHLAIRKDQPTGKWKWLTVGGWFAAEFLGILLGVILFGTGNMIGLFLLGIISAVGGYLFVKAQLEKLPDSIEEDIERLGE